MTVEAEGETVGWSGGEGFLGQLCSSWAVKLSSVAVSSCVRVLLDYFGRSYPEQGSLGAEKDRLPLVATLPSQH